MSLHSLLKEKQYNSWRELERKIELIQNTTEKGDVFEQISYFYFMYHSKFYKVKEIFSSKVPGKNIPEQLLKRLNLSKKDDGVDGLIVTEDGKFIAYQAKFRTDRKSPSSNELNNFWSEAEYSDYRLVVTNASSLPSDTIKRKNGLSVLVDKFDKLDNNFFEYLYSAAVSEDFSKQTTQKLRPLPFQEEILNAIDSGFKMVNRGRLIAACATGKTLLSLWASENLNTNTVLFLAPNLALIRQSIERWAQNANEPFSYLAVCSDTSISQGLEDEIDIQLNEMDVPVTTNYNDVHSFISMKQKEKKVIFSTYQSVEVIKDAIASDKDLDFKFDLVIFDEAHRTAGNSQSALFNLALNDENIPAQKRLFMTATERLVKPWIKERFEQEDRVVFSMDDEELYGPVFYKLTFGEAIKRKIISDYKIVLAGITNHEYQNLINARRYVSSQFASNIPAHLLFKMSLLCKTVKEVGIEKVVSFHSNISEARQFTEILSNAPQEFLEQFNIHSEKSAFKHVNGSQPSSVRMQHFSEFGNSEFGLLSNVRCLTEGVDLPFIDAIMFADPKNSIIDIVQAVGRALRKPFTMESKLSHIIIPIILEDDGSFVDEDLETLHNVLQALRAEDDTLEEWIGEINLGVVTGKHQRRQASNKKFKLILPKQIDFNDFSNHIALKISEVNRKPSNGSGTLYSLEGKNQRKSDYKRVFKCIADYNPDVIKEKLVDPTMSLYDKTNDIKERKEIVVNNNNISHTNRLGLIRKLNANNFELTELGRMYYKKEIDFDRLFCNQILLYNIEDNGEVLFPYREAIKILLRSKTINYVEFLYSIYSLRANSHPEKEVEKGVCFIEYIRKEYPNVMLTNSANQDLVRKELNSHNHFEFSEKDVWTDRTTSGNQYRFFVNHMLKFKDAFSYEKETKTLKVLPDGIEKCSIYLNISKATLEGQDFSYGESVWNI